MSHNPPWKSEVKPVIPGATVDYYDFVPLLGPGGGRVVVDKFYLCVIGTITVATAAWDGRDVPRLAQLITIEQRDGKQRWNLSGYKSRIASIRYNGIERHQEHANVAVGAAQAVDLRLILPMTKPKLKRGKDFALPSDVLKKLTITWAGLSSAQTGTTVLSANSLQAYILASWHEERSVEIKAEDVVKSADFHSTTQAKLSLQGVVHDLDVVLENSTAGGGVITSIVDARIEDLAISLLTRQDFVHDYRVKRALAASGPTTPGTERFLEPVQEGKSLPIICSDAETSLWDGKVVDNAKVDIGGGVAGLSIITREVTEKSQATFNATCERFRITDPTRMLRMKTEGKSRRGLQEGWTQRQKMVGVWSAPMPSRA